MAALKAGDRVEHVSDASLGVGVVDFVKEVADVRTASVVWGGAPRSSCITPRRNFASSRIWPASSRAQGQAPRCRSSYGFSAAGSRPATSKPAKSRTSRSTCCRTRSSSRTV